MKQFKPLLAVQVDDVSKLEYPVMVSPKLDGIRAIVIEGQIVSRNLKPIRNKYIQSVLGKPCFNGLDGELIVGSATENTTYETQVVEGQNVEIDKGVFRNTTTGVMSEDGTPDFTFYVFDNYLDPNGFSIRYERLNQWFADLPEAMKKHIKVLHHNTVSDPTRLNEVEELYLQQGYEGAMVRHMQGVYKYGRSTLKEQILLKVKRFVDMEVKVTGFQERMHNANEAKVDALGHTERSSHKENMIPRGDLGALIVDFKGQELSVGTGFTDALRKEIWDNKEKYLGKLITIKFFDYGNYDVPRFPVFKGFRDTNDISE